MISLSLTKVAARARTLAVNYDNQRRTYTIMAKDTRVGTYVVTKNDNKLRRVVGLVEAPYYRRLLFGSGRKAMDYNCINITALGFVKTEEN